LIVIDRGRGPEGFAGAIDVTGGACGAGPTINSTEESIKEN
jgi:hypothetical protein